VAAGALPFSCQGSDNGLTIDGGSTLGWELADQLASAEAQPARLFVQVGGGALASSVMTGLSDAVRLGVLPRLPALLAVQTTGASPLARAYERVAERVAAGGAPDEVLAYAATHRSQFMWPWETEPRSLAHGILDDETYDWLAVVGALLASGGQPVVVDEAALEEANQLARKATGIVVDHTGSAGLAGALTVGSGSPVGGDVVLFTGSGAGSPS
jgi:threonine synthase